MKHKRISYLKNVVFTKKECWIMQIVETFDKGSQL